MGMTAGSIITEAKKQAHPHTGPQRIADAALLSTLHSKDRELAQTVSQINPDILSTRVDQVTISTSKNSRGYRLQPSPLYRDFVYIGEDDDVQDLTIVRYQDLHRPPKNPAGAVVGDENFSSSRFFPSDPNGERWEGDDGRTYFTGDGDSFAYSYVHQKEVFDSLDDDLACPELAREVLTQSIVLAILSQQTGVPQQRLELALQQHDQARQTFIMQVYKFVMPERRGSDRRRTTWDRIQEWIE